MTPDRTEQLIRDAFADQAARAPDSREVLAGLRGERRRRGFALATTAVVVAVIAVAAFVVPEVFDRSAPVPPAEQQREGAAVTPTSLLVVGVDEADNTDVVMLTQLHADHSVSLISLPRDTWTRGPAGMAKLNRVYAEHGVEGLRTTVRDLTGVLPEHYAVLEMSTVADLVDAVGGVRVCLNSGADDDFANAHFPPGEQVLAGDAALAFIRQRHGLPNGDLDRIRRQQVFSLSLARQLRGADLEAALAAVRGRVTTDDGLDLLGLAQDLTTAKTVRVGVIPALDLDFRTPEGGAAISVDPARVREYVTGIDGPQPGGETVPCVD
jgi:LCP family protein required for cell wall assembly